MGVSNGDEDGGGFDGDGFGGNPPSRQGAGAETSIPRTSSSMAASLWNFSWIDTIRFRVFASEAFYRWKGDVRGHPRGPHHGLAWPQGGRAPLGGVATSVPSSVSALDFIFVLEKIGGLAFVSSNYENISYTTFLKYKNNRKQKLALWHLVNRLVLENA
jgi:hypothetical protein